MMEHAPILFILIPVITAIIIYVLRSRWSHYLAFFAQIIVTVLAVIYYVDIAPHFVSGVIYFIGDWDVIGIPLMNDRLSAVLVSLTIFVWWMVLIYKFRPKEAEPTFLFFLLFLEGVFLGLLQTSDLFNLFVFMELTTIIVTILVAFKKMGSSIRAGVYYLLLNTAGVLMFLIGVVLLYYTFGTINMLEIRNGMEGLAPGHTVVGLAYVLMMAGISVKAALFPVFAWLPRAHGVAQSAVSALLSGLIVKGGIYLFIRLNGMFSPADFDYMDFFFFVGLATALTGSLFAMMQKNIKVLLAYSTLTQVGLIIIGLVSLDDYSAGLLHVVHHALFKGLLFFAAGIIVSVYRTKDITKISGLMRSMPIVSIFMIIGMLAITGAPFMNGYISKALITDALYDDPLRYYAVFLVNIGSAAAFVKLSMIFFGPKTLSYPHKNYAQIVPLAVISLACFVFGIFHESLGEILFGFDVSAVDPFTFTALATYIVTIAFGFLLYHHLIRPDRKGVRRLRRFTVTFETANYLFVIYVAVLTGFFLLL